MCGWMGTIGQPISRKTLRVKVAELSRVLQETAKETGKQHLPSINWVYAFLGRHPDVDLKQPTGPDPLRRMQNLYPPTTVVLSTTITTPPLSQQQ